jgi:hypothetical protein
MVTPKVTEIRPPLEAVAPDPINTGHPSAPRPAASV